MKRWGTRVIVGAVLVATAATGCSEAEPKATPPSPTATPTSMATPTATPTPTEEPQGPERPDLSQVNAATAEALALYYLQSYVRAFATGDPSELSEFAHPDCTFCADVIAGVNADAQAGKWTSGGELKFSDIETSEVSDVFFAVQVTLNQAEMRLHDASGASLASYEPVVTRAEVGVLYDGGAWKIVGVDTNIYE